MAEYVFGAGQLYGTPLASASNPNPSPRRFGVTQDASLDISSDTKELYGSKQFPVDVRSGKFKITCSAKFAQIDVRQFNELFLGGTTTAGSIQFAIDELQTVPAATAYTVTASFAGAAGISFDQDKGVAYVSSGLSLQQVPSTATVMVGQYQVSATGVYTFSAPDAGQQILISYSYASAPAAGFTVRMPNRQMGSTVYFQIDLTAPANGEQLNCRLYKCMSSKLTLGTKIDDYMIPEMSIMAMDPGSGFPLAFYANE
jgi:hypothetical protein